MATYLGGGQRGRLHCDIGGRLAIDGRRTAAPRGFRAPRLDARQRYVVVSYSARTLFHSNTWSPSTVSPLATGAALSSRSSRSGSRRATFMGCSASTAPGKSTLLEADVGPTVRDGRHGSFARPRSGRAPPELPRRRLRAARGRAGAEHVGARLRPLASAVLSAFRSRAVRALSARVRAARRTSAISPRSRTVSRRNSCSRSAWRAKRSSCCSTSRRMGSTFRRRACLRRVIAEAVSDRAAVRDLDASGARSRHADGSPS